MAGTNGGLFGEVIPNLSGARPVDNDRAKAAREFRDGGDEDMFLLPNPIFGPPPSSPPPPATDGFREPKECDSAAGPGLTGGRGRGEALRSPFHAAAAAEAIPLAARTRGIVRNCGVVPTERDRLEPDLERAPEGGGQESNNPLLERLGEPEVIVSGAVEVGRAGGGGSMRSRGPS